MNQLVSVSLLMMITSSALITNTLAALVLDQDTIKAICEPKNPLLKNALAPVRAAIDQSHNEGKDFTKRELNREYKEAMKYIDTFDNEWIVISVPKEPGTPTPPDVLKNQHDRATMLRIYLELHLVRHALIQRRFEAEKMNLLANKIMFLMFERSIDEVINKILELLPPFKVIPDTPAKYPHLRTSTDKAEHNLRNLVILHDHTVLMEYTFDVIKYLLKTYCGIDTNM